MREELNEVKRHYEDQYYDEEITERLKRNVIHQMKNTPANKTFKKKLIYVGSAAAILLLLFSSAFISPAMAQIMVKIPFLQSIFISNSIDGLIMEELISEGYSVLKVQTNSEVDHKEIIVTLLGGQTYYADVKTEVESIAKSSLKELESDSYKVKLHFQKDNFKQTPLEAWKKFVAVEADISKEIEQKGFGNIDIGMKGELEGIHLQVPKNEKNIPELEKVIHSVLEKHQLENLPVSLMEINTKEHRQIEKWSTVIDVLREELVVRSEYGVYRVQYDYEHESVIKVYTSLNNEDESNKLSKNEIEDVITDYLHSKEVQSVLQGEKYTLLLFDENRELLK